MDTTPFYFIPIALLVAWFLPSIVSVLIFVFPLLILPAVLLEFFDVGPMKHVKKGAVHVKNKSVEGVKKSLPKRKNHGHH